MATPFERYMKAEINALMKSIYIESEKAGRDLSKDKHFFQEWVIEHSKDFHDFWPCSLCCTCLNNSTCMDQLKETCERYILDPEV